MSGTLHRPLLHAVTDPLLALILAAAPGVARGEQPVHIARHAGQASDRAFARLRGGRTLVVKRGRHDGSLGRYQASRIATGLLAAAGDVRVPEPLAIPPSLEALPVQAYWWLEGETLDERWDGLDAAERHEVLRSWGGLVASVHAIRLPGHGPLPRAMRERVPLSQFLAEDLGGRMMPAVAADWSGGRRAVEDLLECIPDVARRDPGRPVLLHGDLHPNNVLCAAGSGATRCVGLLDLEDVVAGPPEYDFARLEVFGGPRFGPGAADWWTSVRAGYGTPLDGATLAYFRAYHLANLGLRRARLGHPERAARLAEDARAELARTNWSDPARAD